jgi:hypothetical protein
MGYKPIYPQTWLLSGNLHLSSAFATRHGRRFLALQPEWKSRSIVPQWRQLAGLTPLENRTLLDSEDSTVGFSNGVSHAATL